MAREAAVFQVHRMGLGGGWGLGGWGWGLQRGAASAAEIAVPCGCVQEQLAVGPQPNRGVIF